MLVAFSTPLIPFPLHPLQVRFRNFRPLLFRRRKFPIQINCANSLHNLLINLSGPFLPHINHFLLTIGYKSATYSL